MSKWWLVHVDEDGNVLERTRLPQEKTKIGREWFQQNLKVPEVLQLSEPHIQITPANEGVVFKFLGRNKPALNGEGLQINVEVLITPEHQFNLVANRSKFRVEKVAQGRPDIRRVETDEVLNAEPEDMDILINGYLNQRNDSTSSPIQSATQGGTQQGTPVRSTFATPSSAPIIASPSSYAHQSSLPTSTQRNTQRQDSIPEWLANQLTQEHEMSNPAPSAFAYESGTTASDKSEAEESDFIGDDVVDQEVQLSQYGKKLISELEQVESLAETTRNLVTKLEGKKRRVPSQASRKPARRRRRTAKGLYSHSVRKELKQDYPDAEASIISKMIATRWRHLTNEEREEFEDRAHALNEEIMDDDEDERQTGDSD
jgi:hypothetical protein